MSIAIQEIQKFGIRIDEEVRRIELGSYFPRFICDGSKAMERREPSRRMLHGE